MKFGTKIIHNISKFEAIYARLIEKHTDVDRGEHVYYIL